MLISIYLPKTLRKMTSKIGFGDLKCKIYFEGTENDWEWWLDHGDSLSLTRQQRLYEDQFNYDVEYNVTKEEYEKIKQG